MKRRYRSEVEVYKGFPKCNDRMYAIIAKQYIGKKVILPASKKYAIGEYLIEYINKIPRSIQQRIAGSNSTSWNNMCSIYNGFAEEIGYIPIPLVDYVEEEEIDYGETTCYEDNYFDKFSELKGKIA